MNSLALKLFARDWRSGELRLLTLSLIVAISTMTCISLFTDRIKHSIIEQGGQVLAADAQVRGSATPEPPWLAKAREEGISTAMSTSLSVMAFSGEHMKLSSIKAVSSSYPLKGSLSISSMPFGEGEVVLHGPPSGEAWVDSGLFSSLAIVVGDSIEVGDTTLVVSAALIKEPDINMGAIFSGSRILMHENDLANTGALQPGSRVRYHWMLSGSDGEIERFKQWLKPQLGIHHWWVDAANGSENLASTTDRAQSFLLLAGCLSVVLAGVAVALAARRYAYKQRKAVALLKTLGLTPTKVTRLYFIYMLLLGVLASVVGVALGWGLHWGILYSLQGMLPSELPSASLKAYWSGAASGYVALLAFAGPPLFALRYIPPVVVIRDVMNVRRMTLVVNGLIGLLAMLALVYWYSQSIMISAVLFGALLICVIGGSGMAWLLTVFAKFAGKFMSGYWRLGLANVYRHRKYNVLQMMIFTTLLMLLFVLFLVRTSLIESWQKTMPDNAPNYFIYNIFTEEKDRVADFLVEYDVELQPFYPIVRGRLSAVNGKAFTWLEGDEKRQNRYVRELGLTWSGTVAKRNVLEEGLWWPDLQPGINKANQYVSIERSFADGMGLKIGDKLTMSIAGAEFVTEVASIRKVEWASTTPNFFMVFQNPILNALDANWVTSFYTPSEGIVTINQLAKEFPTVTLLAVDQILKQMKTIIRQITAAIEFILMLVLVAGLLVLITGIQATLDERLKESAVLRTLGANRRLVKWSLLVEFCGIGLASGILATLGAEACLAMLQNKIFSMSFQPNWLLLVVGPLLGMFLIGTIGWLSTRKVTETPPLLILRGLDS